MKKTSEEFYVEIEGELAMFTTPQSKLQCERVSYPFPTYSALQGIMTAIYHQKGMRWVIDECRVMNRIEYVDVSMLYSTYCMSKYFKRQQFINCYLKNPRYQIKAHYVRDARYYTHSGYYKDHGKRIHEVLQNGNGRFVKLGAGNCVAYYKECKWGKDIGYYDNDGDSEEVRMFYDFQRKNGQIEEVGFCLQKMHNGIISFSNIPKVYRKWRM